MHEPCYRCGRKDCRPNDEGLCWRCWQEPAKPLSWRMIVSASASGLLIAAALTMGALALVVEYRRWTDAPDSEAPAIQYNPPLVGSDAAGFP